MLSILIGHSCHLQLDRKQRQRAKPDALLATLQTALLRQAGHERRLFDAMRASAVGEFAAVLHQTHPGAVLLYEDNFNFLSKICLSQMRRANLAMIRMHFPGTRPVAL
jgi:anaerobic magnesium-protoporphyrin IX monomethyl ester cyclase